MTRAAENEDDTEAEIDPERIRSRDDPYADVDVSSLPEWWQQKIEHFRDRGIDPFRPPRFVDGTVTHDVVDGLETELEIEISFRCKNGTVGDDWTVVVDGDPIGSIGRHRSRNRYTVYELSADEFRTLINTTVAEE